MAPGAFVLFCKVTLVSRASGIPPTSTENAPVIVRAGPITEPDAIPVPTPALSPFVMGGDVPRLCAGVHVISTLATNPVLVGSAPTFG